MKEHLRKIISITIVCMMLLCSLSVSSFGASYTNLLGNWQNLGGWLQSNITGSSPTFSYSSSLNTITYNSPTLEYGSALHKTYLNVRNIELDKNYQFSFTWSGYGASNRCPFSVYIEFFDSNNQLLESAEGGFESNQSTSSYLTVSTSFVPSKLLVTQTPIYYMRINFVFSSQGSFSSGNYIRVKDISLICTDEDLQTGLLEGISDWLSRVYHSIAGGTDSQGVIHTGIVAGISSALTTVKNGVVSAINDIEDWLDSVADSINEKLDNVKAGINQSLAAVKTGLENAINALKNWILYFHNPVTLDNNGMPLDEYGNPLYVNIFDVPDIFEWFDEKIEILDDAKTDVETGASEGVDAFENTIAPLSTIIQRVPFLVVFITFALAVIVIKKVIT